MFIKPLVALSFATLSIARALPIAKRDSSTHWWSGLEPYKTYHARYIELDCENKHNTSFFTQCCHPRSKDADISKIPEQCLGSDDTCDDDDNDNDNNDGNPTTPVNVAPNPSVPASPPASTPTSTGSDDGNVIKGNGDGTFYLQNGNAGACGQFHPDSDKIVALDSQLYGDTGEVSQYCGKTIEITNTANGKSVKAVVADACPTCVSKGSVDMSVGTFTEIAAEATGDIKISWVLYL